MALFELIENAAKHAGDPAVVAVNVTVSDLQVTCTIRDSGPGLPQTERDVFETGLETPLVHGQGLGLWLSYWIITTLDGEINVTDDDDGATVGIRLPRPGGANEWRLKMV